MVVAEENESFSTRVSCFAEFAFISISFLFFVILRSHEHASKNEPMATSPKENQSAVWGSASFSWPTVIRNLSKIFAGRRRTFTADQRTPEKEQPASKRAGEKPGVEPFVFARVLEQVRQSERDMKPQLTLFMNDTQLKKLVNEAVSLHRALTTYSERLKELKG